MNKFENTQERIAALKAAKVALRATCQLYQYKKERSELFVANGCAVLFEYNTNYYCLSNAHVLADLQLGKTFFLGNDGTSVTVGGQIFYTRLPESKNRKDDSLDIAVVKLDRDVAIFLEENGQQFLAAQQVQTGVSLSKNIISMIAGYPASKMDIDFKSNRLKFEPLIVRTIPFLKDLKRINFPKELHHVVQYPIQSFKEQSTGVKWIAPQPHGLSGSGLWLLHGESNLNYQPILIGILSEYHDNRAILISTKIDLFIDLIRQKFDPNIKNNGIQLELFLLQIIDQPQKHKKNCYNYLLPPTSLEKFVQNVKQIINKNQPCLVSVRNRG